MIDTDEVEALQQELKEYQSLPKTDFQGLEPAGRLLPRRKVDEKDEEVITAEFEKIAQESRCRVLGNGLAFHTDLGLIEDDVEMGYLLDRWIDRKASRQEHTAKQPDRLLYEEVAWLNQSGIHKEPQISYGIVGCIGFPFTLESC